MVASGPATQGPKGDASPSGEMTPLSRDVKLYLLAVVSTNALHPSSHANRICYLLLSK